MLQCNKGQSLSRQQEIQESVLRQIEKIIFQDHEAASNSKENSFIEPRQS